jgi:hypothetical protein
MKMSFLLAASTLMLLYPMAMLLSAILSGMLEHGEERFPLVLC